jgi:poly(A) polymerase
VIPERLQPILDDVRPLAERFAAAGHETYLVGGIVRDVVLDRVHHGADLDLTTDARPEETLALLEGWSDSTWTQGQAFGTIGARKGGVTFEITTHRAEAYRRTRASRTSSTPTTSSTTCPAATSRSTPWRCGCPMSS